MDEQPKDRQKQWQIDSTPGREVELHWRDYNWKAFHFKQKGEVGERSAEDKREVVLAELRDLAMWMSKQKRDKSNGK